MYIGAKREPDLDILSGSDIECLDKSISENIHLDFFELTKNSHDEAWQKANSNDEMSFLDMAQSGGANTEMLSYIVVNMENQKSFSCP